MLHANGMNRPYILFVSDTTGFRVGKIAQGVLRECRRSGLGLLWRESDRVERLALGPAPLGVIIRDKLPAIERVAARLKGAVPLVSTIGHTLDRAIHTVVPDPQAIARQVAAHLVAEGLRRFVFVGPRDHPAARVRAAAFAAELGRLLRGPASLEFFDTDLGDRFWGADSACGRAFVRLLKKAPTPLGMLAFTDQIAASCLECAEVAGVPVPQRMSIVGVDDHPIFTAMHVPLSSVRIDYEEIGRQAVALVRELAARRRRGAEPIRRFVGGELIVRQSSQPRLLGDEPIARVLRHLHAHYGETIALPELARLAGMSRTSFVARFQRAVGRAPIRHLIDLRLQHARLLLAESALTVSEIAYRVGFADQGYFTRAFKQLCRATPTDYRRRHARREP